jgi:hypothetical protein
MGSMISPRPSSQSSNVEPWVGVLLDNLYRLAFARPAVARLIGIWIAEALERSADRRG